MYNDCAVDQHRFRLVCIVSGCTRLGAPPNKRSATYHIIFTSVVGGGIAPNVWCVIWYTLAARVCVRTMSLSGLDSRGVFFFFKV